MSAARGDAPLPTVATATPPRAGTAGRGRNGLPSLVPGAWSLRRRARPGPIGAPREAIPVSVPTTTLLPFQPATMTTAQLAAVSYLARYAGRTNVLYTCQLGLDRLELIRFLQVAQTLTVHHSALAYLLGINAQRASEAAAGADRGLRRHPARPPGPAPAWQGQQARDHAGHRPGHRPGAARAGTCRARTRASRSTARPQASHDTSAPTSCATPRSPTPWTRR